MNEPEFPEGTNLSAQTIAVSVFNQVSPGLYEFTHLPFGLSIVGSHFCAKAQTKDSVLRLVIQYVFKGDTPKVLSYFQNWF